MSKTIEWIWKTWYAIPREIREKLSAEMTDLKKEYEGFWTADWTDWREQCRFIAERLEHYAKRFREHAEAE